MGRLYKGDNEEILDFWESILSFPHLKVLDKELVMAAISLAQETNETFADSYIAASIHRVQADNVATFNKKHFVKLGLELYPLERDQ